MLASTGAGGPDPQDGIEVGTVFIAVCASGDHHVQECHFAGDPGEVVDRTTAQVLDTLAAQVGAR